VEKKLGEDYTDQEIAAEADVLKLLGLLPGKLDYKKTVLTLMKEQVAGFYDPKTRRLNLAAWIPLDLQEPALAHEICHALQDQHFNLRRLVKPIKNNSDQQLAQAALVEGDCTGVMVEYVLRKQGLDLGSMPDSMAKTVRQNIAGQATGAFAAAPVYMRDTLMFPYIHGLEMVRKIRSRHPWRQVNAMYRRPPRSTEQVLHYDKYWQRERPTQVQRPRRPPPSLKGHALLREDVLGELQLSIFLAQGVSAAVARRAAEGWGGDQLAAYRRKPDPQEPDQPADAAGPLVVHLSTWDSDADALEFANATRHVLRRRRLVPGVHGPGLWTYTEPQKPGAPRGPGKKTDPAEAPADKPGAAGQPRRWAVQLHDQHVLCLMAVPDDLFPALLKEVWAHWRIDRRRVKAPKLEMKD